MLGEMNSLFKANKLENTISYTIFVFHQILLFFNHEITYDFIPFVVFVVFLIYSLYTHNMILESIKFWNIYNILYNKFLELTFCRNLVKSVNLSIKKPIKINDRGGF